MLEESMSTVPSPSPSSSLWSSIFSWFTPTVFFVFVNLTIGTIFFTSTFSSNNPSVGVGEGQTLHEGDGSKNDPKLVRSEEPVGSLTATTQDTSGDVHFSFHKRNIPEQTPTHPLPTQQQPQEEEGDQEPQVPKEVQYEATQGEERGFDGIHSEPKGNSEVTRTKSDVEPASGQVPIKLARKMRKSASVKSPFSHFEEDEILEARRPASVREIRKGKAWEEDDEVDAKADDFINKFKQQLLLENFI